MPSETQWNVALQQEDKKLVRKAKGRRTLSQAETIRLALKLLSQINDYEANGKMLAIVDGKGNVETKIMMM